MKLTRNSMQQSQPVTKFPTFYGIQWFTTMFRWAYHWVQSWARKNQLKLSHHFFRMQLNLSLSSGLFLSGFPIKILYAFLTTFMYTTWPAHLILPYLITLIIMKFYYIRNGHKQILSNDASIMHLSEKIEFMSIYKIHTCTVIPICKGAICPRTK